MGSDGKGQRQGREFVGGATSLDIRPPYLLFESWSLVPSLRDTYGWRLDVCSLEARLDASNLVDLIPFIP